MKKKNNQFVYGYVLVTLLMLFITSCKNDDASEPAIEIEVKAFTTTTMENVAVGTSLGIVEATSSAGTMSFAIDTQSSPDAVAINATTGELTVNDAEAFDYETNTSITGKIEVSVEDVIEMADFTITITDVLEIVATDFTTSIEENITNGTSLGAVDASTTTGELSYTISSQTPSDAVTIDTATGELSVQSATAFDYEANTTIVGEIEISVDDVVKVINFTVTLIDVPDNPFVTTWQTTEPNESILIRTNQHISDYDYTIDWGDGTVETNQTGDATHSYSSPDTYTVKITESFPSLFQYASDIVNAAKLQTIESWGHIKWQSMASAFRNCVNLTYNATDKPDLSQVTNMSFMFRAASSFNGDIGDWDVSNVTNMSFLFYQASAFNQDISSWDVGNVTNMRALFGKASSFNSDIHDWDVGSGDNMSSMFESATSFNQDIGSWDVSSATSMLSMFASATVFNQDIGKWDVGNVTDMGYMFHNASAFNQNLNEWKTSNVSFCVGFDLLSALTSENLPTTGNCFESK